jgi:hypothetical protein
VQGRVLARVFRHRFTVLLATLLALMLVAPAVLEAVEAVAPAAGAVVYLVLFACVLLAAILAVSGRRGVMEFAISLAIPILLLDLAALFLWPGELPLLRHGTRVIFISFVIVVLLRHLFQQHRITFDTISASLCAFLLLGAFWANVFSILETAAPGSFVDTVRPASLGTRATSEEARSARMLYFSFVTLSTIGYGDIVPGTMLARMCAVTEAMMGQGYLLVMVSRLVAIQVSQSQPPATTEEPPS